VSILLSDNFNRANENPIAAPWVRHGVGTAVFQLNGNRLLGDLSDIDVVYRSDFSYGSADYKASVNFMVDSTNPGGVMVRRVANGTDDDHYTLTITTTTLAIVKRRAGGNTTIASATISVTNASVHNIRLTATGTGPVALTGELDGVVTVSGSDTTNVLSAIGFPGLRNFFINGVDDFVVEDVAVAAALAGTIRVRSVRLPGSFANPSTHQPFTKILLRPAP
jgi:hypothetical protein